MIRRCTPADLDWMATLGNERYGPLIEGYDPASTRAWLEQAIPDPRILAARGERALAMGLCDAMPWAPSIPYCNLVFVASMPGAVAGYEAFQVISFVNRLRQDLGIKRLYIGAAAVGFRSLNGVAHRLGGRCMGADWVVE